MIFFYVSVQVDPTVTIGKGVGVGGRVRFLFGALCER